MLDVNITLTNGLDIDIKNVKNIRCMNGDIYFISKNGNKTRLFKEKEISSVICMPTNDYSLFTKKEDNDKKMIDKATEIIAGR